MRLKLIVVGLFSLLMSGCVTMSQVNDVAQNLHGLGKNQVLQCLGSPDKQEKVGNSDVWQYYKRSSIQDGSFKSGGFFNTSGFGMQGAAGGLPDYMVSSQKEKYCKMDIIFDGEKVSSVPVNGNRLGECYNMLRACQKN